MLRSDKHLEGFTLSAKDGAIGKVEDFYFDDRAWVVRYVVVNTSTWLGGREVLISPYAIGNANMADKTLPVSVTREQVRNSPGIDTERPVSRQYEKAYLGYYGYPYYWGGTGLWGEGAYPGAMLTGMGIGEYPGYLGYLRPPAAETADSDPHLRSCGAVKKYHVHAKDGEIGHIDGFILDDSTWSIRYLIVNTSNWWIGHQVVISPEWIETVNWSEATVRVTLDREAIKAAPPYTGDTALNRDEEARLYRHYGRDAYWPAPLDRAVA
jgi:hypothetical protein